MEELELQSTSIPVATKDGMIALFRYWMELPGNKSRKSLDPLEIGGRLLPHVSLGAFVEDGADFRYDLISQEMKKAAPRLTPGCRSSDSLRIQQTDFDLIHHLFLSTGRSLEPKALLIDYASMENMARRIYAVFLPLGEQTSADGRKLAEDLMIGLWREEPADEIKYDRFEDLTAAFLGLHATPADLKNKAV